MKKTVTVVAVFFLKKYIHHQYEKFIDPESLKLYASPLFKNTTIVFDKHSGNLCVSFFIPMVENISAIKTNIDKCLGIEECKARLKCM